MLIFNTTYQVSIENARNFVIYAHNEIIPQAEASGDLKNGRLMRILSHRDQETECFSLQFEVQSTARLHHYQLKVGKKISEDLQKLFNKDIYEFSTIMEIIE